MLLVLHISVAPVLVLACLTGSTNCQAPTPNLGLPTYGALPAIVTRRPEQQVSWSSWTPWSSCSASCGGGLQKRIRFCPRQDEHNQGCYGASVQVRRCSLAPCFGRGLLDSWSAWTKWSSCCGQREQLRTRACRVRNVNVQTGRCYGSSLEVRECDSSACSEKYAVASLNMNGVAGNISFRQSSPSSPVLITIQLQGAGLDVPGITWHVHEFPLAHTAAPAQRCSAASAGGHYDPYGRAGLSQYNMRCARNAADCEAGDLSGRHGELTVGATYEDRFLQLTGREGIVGRSLVLHRPDGTRWLCANILPAVAGDGGEMNMRTAVARFAGPVVGGTITVRQPADDPKADSTVLVDLRRTDGMLVDTFLHAWSVNAGPAAHAPANDTLDGSESTRCLSAGMSYDPLGARINTNYARDCNDRQPQSCELGDLAGKHGRLNVPHAGSYRAFYTDSSLPLSGPFSVLGRPIVIHGKDGMGVRVACADLVELLAREMSATFDMDGVTGVMVFSQQSPWDPTRVMLDVAGLAGQAGGFHVHEFPRSVLGTVQYSTQCSGQEVGGHWNPFQAPFPATVAPGFAASHDLYEVGDLSGKHGSLAELQDAKRDFVDALLPLFGPHSIAGRSIVIHRNAAGAPRWVCANIDMPRTSKRSAVARFLSPLAGTVVFRQIDSFETSVLVDLSRADGMPASSAHNWHVHGNRVASTDRFSTTSRCSSARGHYNPFNVSVAAPAYAACSPANQLRCEQGDASGKSSTLDFNAMGATKFVYTDSFLPLVGRFSVMGRSVVVHAANKGAARMACATIEPFAERHSQASFGRAGVSGFVSFRQLGPLSPTVVSVQLSGLRARAGHYSLHYLPTISQSTVATAGSPASAPPSDSCSLNVVGNVYNPTRVAADANQQRLQLQKQHAPDTATADTVAVGELSRKFGSLHRLTGVVSSFLDTHYMPMTGPLNFVGRSVALHRGQGSSSSEQAEPWVCSNIEYLGGRLVTAVAKFTGHLVGEIRFEQVNDLPTRVTIQLQHTQQAAASGNHQWSVNSNPVLGDALSAGAAAGGRCHSAGPVFNPANVTAVDGMYPQRCSLSSLTCRLGDLWYKHGMLRLPSAQLQSAQRIIITEDILPLSGPLSVIGRSVVINGPQMSTDRVACATIQQQ